MAADLTLPILVSIALPLLRENDDDDDDTDSTYLLVPSGNNGLLCTTQASIQAPRH